MSYPTGIALQQLLVTRWVRSVAEGILGAWQAAKSRRFRGRCIDALAELSEAVLRDIGAPDDLVIEAASRRRSEAERLEALRIVANYRGIDARFW